MSKRGARGAKTPKNKKANFKKLGHGAVDIIFGVPHFVFAMANHQLATVEALAHLCIDPKGKVYVYRQRRDTISYDRISTVNDFVNDSITKAKKAFNK